MDYYYQRLLGGLLGFFVVGPLLAVLLLSGGAGVGEFGLAALAGSVSGALVAGRIARAKDRRLLG